MCIRDRSTLFLFHHLSYFGKLVGEWVVALIHFGSITFAMILGHYYLVVPRLSEKPLLKLHYIYWPFLLLKVLFFALHYYDWGLEFSYQNLSDLIFVLMRSLWGYFAIAIVSIFSYKLSKMRSTQSATGVLYVMVFFMLVGEIISLYLFHKEGFLL